MQLSDLFNISKTKWIVLGGVLAALIASFWLGRCTSPKEVEQCQAVEIKRDTVTDTVAIPHPYAVVEKEIEYVPVKLPVKDTVTIIEKGKDTVVIDSIYVEVPITQKEYSDSNYRAWVSGFRPNLDSISVYQRTVTVTKTVQKPSKRWGLGIQLGGGYYGLDKKFGPYIGVGINYDILQW